MKRMMARMICNCRERVRCPLNGNCFINNIKYKATIKEVDNNNETIYVGLTKLNWKVGWLGFMAYQHYWLFDTKSSLYIYIKYMICKHILLTFLN